MLFFLDQFLCFVYRLFFIEVLQGVFPSLVKIGSAFSAQVGDERGLFAALLAFEHGIFSL